MSAQDSIRKLTLEQYYERLCAIVTKAYGEEILQRYSLAPGFSGAYYDEEREERRQNKANSF